MNRLRSVAAICVLIACRSDSPPTRETGSGSARSVALGTGSAGNRTVNDVLPAVPAIRNEATARFVRDAALCPQPGGLLSLDCPALHALQEHSLIFRDSPEAAETCVALLKDANEAVRQAASHCLRQLSPTAIAPVFGAALDAVDAEPRPSIRPEIARGVANAEAVNTPFEPRVRAVIERLAKGTAIDDEEAAGALLLTLFPEHVRKGASPPTVEAQQLLLTSIGRSRGALYGRAVQLAYLVRDKAAACAALRGAIRVDNDEWTDAGIAFAKLGEACITDVPHVIDVALSRAKAGDPNGNVLLQLDRNIDLDAAQRARIASELKASESDALAWKRPDVTEALKAFRSKPVRP